MQNEFPCLEVRDYQKEYLSDWYSSKKLFLTQRRSGKTEMVLSELRRFQRFDLSCLIIVPTARHSEEFKERYFERFKERLTCEIATAFDLKEGRFVGRMYDVVLIDEMQEINDFDHIQNKIMPMVPTFFHATADRSRIHSNHYLNNEPDFFDAVYTDELPF